jgi:hypothetical protein
VDLIGEISLMKDLTRTMDITMSEAEAEEEFEGEEEAKKASLAEEKAKTEGTSTAGAPTGETLHPPAASVTDDKSFTSSNSATFPERPTPSPTPSGTSTPRRTQGIPLRPALMDRTEEEAQMSAAGLTEEEKELRKKEKKKGGLSK